MKERIVLEVSGIVEEIDRSKNRIMFKNGSNIFELNMIGEEIDQLSCNQEVTLNIVIYEAYFDILYAYISKNVYDFVMQFASSVSGVGMKAAVRLYDYLSDKGMSREDICFEISNCNNELVKSIPGIGEKCALRIVETLKNKIQLFEDNNEEFQDVRMEEVSQTLKSLGFKDGDISNVLNHLNVTNSMSQDDILQMAMEKL